MSERVRVRNFPLFFSLLATAAGISTQCSYNASCSEEEEECGILDISLAPEKCDQIAISLVRNQSRDLHWICIPMFVCLTNDTTYLTGNKGQKF